MCQIMGLLPILINGLGFIFVSLPIRVPYPPAKITNFIFISSKFLDNNSI